MALTAKGPFSISWRGNTITDVEDVDLSYDVDSEDYNTVDGRAYTLYGAHKVTVTFTLLGADVAALAVVLPQYHVNNGGVLSTGETVNDADGAIDLVPGGCTKPVTYGPLDITSCGNPGKTLRIVNARSEIDGIEFDDKIRKVSVVFTGEAPSGDAVVQLFEQGSINVIS